MFDEEVLIERLYYSLITGDRTRCRAIVQEALDSGVAPELFAHKIFWPTMDMVATLFRQDQITTLAHHYATRLLRSLVDQMQLNYEQAPSRGRKVLMFCGPSESDEMAAQLVADLAEADGYDVFFGGGGVANDEILGEVGEQSPDILLLFSAAPTDAPHIRQLIDSIREVGAHPNTQIVVGGGVFNRAEGLAEEIGADLWARSPGELLEKLTSQPQRRAPADQRTVGRRRTTSMKAA